MSAKLQSVDEGSIKAIPGIVKVVREGDLLGIVAESEWAAVKAAGAIKAEWATPESLPDSANLWEHVRATYDQLNVMAIEWNRLAPRAHGR